MEEHITEDHGQLTVQNGKSGSTGLRPNLGGIDSDGVQGNSGLRIPNMMFPAPMKTTLKLSVPPTWVVLFQRISRHLVGREMHPLVHRDQPGWIDGGSPGRETRRIARSAPVSRLLELGSSPSWRGLGGGHPQSRRKSAWVRHGGRDGSSDDGAKADIGLLLSCGVK